MTTTLLTPEGWKKTTNNDIEFRKSDIEKARIHRYPEPYICAGCFCAQVWRNSHGVSDLFEHFDAAMAYCIEHLEMPLPTFNQAKADELLAEIKERQEELIKIGHTETINGFDTGHRAGYSNALAKLQSYIEIITTSDREAA